MMSRPRLYPDFRHLPLLRPIHLAPILFILLLAVVLRACKSDKNQEGNTEASTVIEVAATDYAFQTSVTEVPSGWTTLRLENNGKEPHDLEFIRLPEGVTFKEVQKGLGTIDSVRQKLEAGEIDPKEARKHLPAWFSSIEYSGGAGYISPEGTSVTTVNLDPGKYVMACSVKNPEGKFHYQLGMVRPLTVTNDTSGVAPPEADMELTLSDYMVNSQGQLTSGEQTVAIRFGERPKAMDSPLQDIHLAKLGEEDKLEDVIAWTKNDQKPVPTDFLGGAIAMPAGNTVYLKVNLSPGRYAWVSRASAPKDMVKTFTLE